MPEAESDAPVALRGEHRGPEFVRLRQVSPGRLRFSGRSRARAPLLVAPPAFALASLCWFGDVGPTPLQASVSGVLVLAGVGLLYLGLPRRHHASWSVAEGEVVMGPARHSLGKQSRWELQLDASLLAPQCKYVCRLVTSTGTSLELLSGPRPDRVLRDLHRCLATLPLPVASGWGLPARATPWQYAGGGPVPEGAHPTKPVRVTAARTDPRLSRVVFAMTVLTAFILAALAAGQAAVVDASALRWALPSALVAGLCFITVAASAKSQLLADGETVRLRGGILGRASGSIPRECVRAASIVGRDPSKTICHLLLETDRGPLASRVRSEYADQFERDVSTRLHLPRPCTEGTSR